MTLLARAAASPGPTWQKPGPMLPPQTKMVPLSKLAESPDNHRQHFGDLTELADSIRNQGILQPPLVRAVGDGYELVVGHRRLRAAKLAGLREMPVLVTEMTPQAAQEARLAENLQRQDVGPLELADGYAKLMKYGLTGEQVAKRLGIHRSSVFLTLRLLEISEPVKKALLAGKIGAVTASDLVSVDGERRQLAALNDALALGRDGEPPSRRAVQRMLQKKYSGKAKGGLNKRELERRAHGDEVALRRRVVARLLARVVDLVERKHHLDETDLRIAVLALAELGTEPVREAFQRRGERPDRLGRVGATQLRSLLVEVALAPWVQLDEGEYSAAVKATAKAYGVSLAELEKAVAAENSAEALFEK